MTKDKPLVMLLERKPKVPKGIPFGKVGRPLKGDKPMTKAERTRAWRERKRAVSQTPSLAEKKAGI